MGPQQHRRGLVSLLPTRLLRRGTPVSPKWTRTVTEPSPSMNGSPSSSRRSSPRGRPVTVTLHCEAVTGYTGLYSSTQCNTLHYTVLLYNTVEYCTVQYSRVLYSTIQ